MLPREIAEKLMKAAKAKAGDVNVTLRKEAVHVHCEHYNLDGSVRIPPAAKIAEAQLRNLRKPQDITLNTLGARSAKDKDSQELEK